MIRKHPSRPTHYSAPITRQNPEEFDTGNIKRECLNHYICFGKQQLDYINREWLAYCHNHRPHQGVDIGNKVLRADFKPTDKGEIKREQRLGYIISYYCDAA